MCTNSNSFRLKRICVLSPNCTNINQHSLRSFSRILKIFKKIVKRGGLANKVLLCFLRIHSIPNFKPVGTRKKLPRRSKLLWFPFSQSSTALYHRAVGFTFYYGFRKYFCFHKTRIYAFTNFGLVRLLVFALCLCAGSSNL